MSEERANTDQNAKNSDWLCAEHSPAQGQNGINGGVARREETVYAGFGLELEDAERSGVAARFALD